MCNPTNGRRLVVILTLALTATLGFGCGDTMVRGNAGNGDPCEKTNDCLPGLACNSGGVCAGQATNPDGSTADMNTDGPGDGTTGDGSSMNDVTGGDSTCAAIDLQFDAVVPTIIILVDRSGSMTETFGAVDRWQAVQDALFDPTNGVVSTYQDAVRFGIATYNNEGNACPQIGSVSAMLGNNTDMAGLMAGQSPAGDTPTGEAIIEVLPLFQEVQERVPKVLLLATDGEPDTCAVPNPQEGQPESVAAVESALMQGVRTFVLSVGSDVGEPHLQDLANAGVGENSGTNAPFWKADDPVALQHGIAEIITGSRPCAFGVSGAMIDPTRANLGTVSLNGQPLDHAGPNGWTLIVGDQRCANVAQCVELHGEACETVQLDPAPQLDASFPCEAAQ